MQQKALKNLRPHLLAQCLQIIHNLDYLTIFDVKATACEQDIILIHVQVLIHISVDQ